MTPPPVPPGWYDDPESPLRLRYYDGSDWTEHTTVKAPTPAARQSGNSNVAIWIIVGLVAIIAAPFALVMFAASGAAEDTADGIRGIEIALDEMTGTVFGVAVTGAILIGLGWFIGRREKRPTWAFICGVLMLALSAAAVAQWLTTRYAFNRDPWLLAAAGVVAAGGLALIAIGFARRRSAD